MALLRRWPPVLWLLVYVGSIFILNGGNGKWDTLELALGIGLAVLACLLAIYLAVGPWRGRPRWTGPLIGGVFAFYAVCALPAAPFSRPPGTIPPPPPGGLPLTPPAPWLPPP